jgi:maleate isomerase
MIFCSTLIDQGYLCDEINHHLKDHLSQNRFEVSIMRSWNELLDAKVGRISPELIFEAALDLGCSDKVDTVFISCTNLRALGIISELESRLDKPVISSNQARGWHCLRPAGVEAQSPQFGRLFSCPPVNLNPGNPSTVAERVPVK